MTQLQRKRLPPLIAAASPRLGDLPHPVEYDPSPLLIWRVGREMSGGGVSTRPHGGGESFFERQGLPLLAERKPPDDGNPRGDGHEPPFVERLQGFGDQQTLHVKGLGHGSQRRPLCPDLGKMGEDDVFDVVQVQWVGRDDFRFGCQRGKGWGAKPAPGAEEVV